ncbi:hypothetical protein NQ315_013440 [Exocentrus adspersus]|uniref:UBX domain-containing protein 1 n=1 Tax=Exocentrus adspersus TaxID=1586481 RepID=A0AAV8VHE5_9CUCU|nr:hypothetical protein NQ315_013440 [Exocentrus adspersus]
MPSVVDTLIEMGFSKERAELAVNRTGSNDVQTATEWLLSNEDVVAAETIPASEEQQDSNTNTASEENMEESTPEVVPVAKSIQCDDCGKLFKTNEEVEFHASKSGHENFSESTEEKKPLTEEEKKEQLAKIEAKLRQRRLEREAREKEEALLKEKIRIKSGKELLEAKKKHDELEMKKIVEQRKREKEEERLARQRVKEQIEQDKLARKAKFGGNTNVEAAPPVAKPIVERSATSQNYSEVKIQVRLPNGSVLTHTFGAKEPLSAVRLYVEMNRQDADGPFNLVTSFPRKVFASDDYDKPLETLGLAPTATLFVQKRA